MGIKKIIASGLKYFLDDSSDEQTENTNSPEQYYGGSGGQWWPVKNRVWDGEKTAGELGVVYNNIPDYRKLRLRAYAASDTIDIIQTITSKFFKYIIGEGLKLQAQPNLTVLELEDIKLPSDDFKKAAEARFLVYGNSKLPSQNNLQDLHDLGNDAFSTSFLGGDVLIILRVKKGILKVQVVDGEQIVTPSLYPELLKEVKERGNYVTHGIEYNDAGEHVGFFVSVKDSEKPLGDIKYVPAKGLKSGRTLAWMIYGKKQRPDQKRGIPVISAILEKVNKLDRYTEAAVGKAEEAAKQMMAIKHGTDSTGENPFTKAMTKKLNPAGEEEIKSSYELGDTLANKVNQTTSKQVVNLPVGAELDSFETDIESKFDDFHTAIFNGLCASVDLPPEVALQLYNSNYSASRAAIGAWQFIVEIYRHRFAKEFYKRIYTIWLEVEVLKNKIQAPGFVTALELKDEMVLEAYSSCRFTGKKMPHIDPLKEVKAARLTLADNDTPLSSFEAVVEDLNLGDFSDNYAKYLKERDSLKPLTKPEPIKTE